MANKVASMTDEEKKAFGNKVKHLLIDRDMSQNELAEVVGVSAPFMSCILKGTKAPPLGVTKLIADKLGVKVDDLLKE